jgi:hypothetical protein
MCSLSACPPPKIPSSALQPLKPFIRLRQLHGNAICKMSPLTASWIRSELLKVFPLGSGRDVGFVNLLTFAEAVRTLPPAEPWENRIERVFRNVVFIGEAYFSLWFVQCFRRQHAPHSWDSSMLTFFELSWEQEYWPDVHWYCTF